MSVPDTGGTFVYHPLGSFTPTYEAWKSAIAARPSGAPLVPPEVLKGYRSHLAARLRDLKRAEAPILPDVFEEDRRELVQQFRAFFPVFLQRIGAPPDRAQIPISFPKFGVFDARVMDLEKGQGIFVSSRVLDVIELFARTMSLCGRLNGLALPILIGAEDPPPAFVILAWLPLMEMGVPGFRLAELDRIPSRQLREKIFKQIATFPEEWRRPFGRWRLTHYLAQAMLLAMEKLLRDNGREGEAFLDIPKLMPPLTAKASLDALYLANLVLTYIVLHEHAHLVHRHSSFEPMEEDPQLKEVVDGMLRSAEEKGGGAVDLRGSTLQLEQDADCFWVAMASADYRDPLLEAATLWLAALGCTDRGGIDWLKRSEESEGRAYPQYAMRVWFMNGCFSTGARRGEIAQTITLTAEAIEKQPSMAALDAGIWLSVFRELWAIAEDEAELRLSWGGRLFGLWRRGKSKL